MILLVDIGNSSLHWARKRGADLSPAEHIRHQGKISVQMLEAAWAAVPHPQQILLASVAGSRVTALVVDWCRETWDIEPRRVKTQQEQAGVTNAYRDPQKLGIDRWLALVAARQSGNSPCCIADCGSAITIDIMDGDGHHQGGFILPGLAMMRGALVAGTAGVGEPDSGEAGNGFTGINTGEAISKGSLLAAAGTIEQAAGWATRKMGGSVRVILTGGDAQRIGARLSVEWQYIPDLVLRGLAELAENPE